MSKLTATTGAAASLLPLATTIHSLMGIWKSGDKMCYPFIITDKKANAVRIRMGDAKHLVIDEVSMLTPKILSLTNAILQAVFNSTELFGGISILLVGDFDQKEPCGGAKQTLYQILVNYTQCNEMKNKTVENAASLFANFKKIDLTTQHRTNPEETKHLELIQNMRKDEQPITKTRLLQIKQLSLEDTKDVAWKFAPLVVTSNAERDRLNKLQAKRNAHHYKEPILVYYDPIRNASGICDPDGEDSKDLSTVLPRLKRYFVRGAPCTLTKNINPSVKLANGTNKNTTFLSLTWSPDTKHHNINLLRRGKLKPGVEYEVPFPHSVNILSNNVEVPVLSYKARINVPKYLRYNLEPGKRALLHQSHAVELGFAYTDFKIQGATVEKLILLLMKRPSVPHLTIGSVYVGFTRVKRNEDLRIWPMKIVDDNIIHLTKLKRSVGLRMWKNNYINGRWNMAGFKNYNTKKYKIAIETLQSINLASTNIAELRKLAKELNIQHRNIPINPLLKILQRLQTQNNIPRKKKTSRRHKQTVNNKKRKRTATPRHTKHKRQKHKKKK